MLYRAPRLSSFHNRLRRFAYALARILPLRWRYAIGRLSRKYRLPYRLLDAGSTVVQIGAPWDLLAMGRSRSMHFSYFVGETGRVIVVEPEPENVEKLREHIEKFDIRNVIVVAKGAWSESGFLSFLSDPEHPAANLVESVFDEARSDRKRFDSTEIEVDTLETILADLDVENIRLLSLTTNGSEIPIINGMGRYLARTKFLSVVGKRAKYRFLHDLGFRYLSDDDRGYLYIRRDS